MHQNKKILAVIPARGGSKGLPGKNIKPLCGKPLIAWSIEAGLNSEYIDEVMVTTDSENIVDVAKGYGAHVPFIRPEYLATDTATTFDVVKHAIEFYQTELNQYFDYVVLLEPTSPLRRSTDIDQAFELMVSQEHKALVGVCQAEAIHPDFMVEKNAGTGCLVPYTDNAFKVLRRQDVKPLYFFEGSVYISEIDLFLKRRGFYHNQTMGYEVEKWQSLEIDDMDDFVMVEAMMKHKGFV